MKQIEPTAAALARYEATKAKGADGLVVEIDDDWSDVEKAFQAAQLKTQGHSWREIARLVGYPTSQHALVVVRQYQQREALSREANFREAILDLELERTEEIIKNYWPTAMAGEVKHAELILKTIATQARMLGLEELHTKTVQSTKTIVIAGNAQEYASALQAIVEADES